MKEMTNSGMKWEMEESEAGGELEEEELKRFSEGEEKEERRRGVDIQDGSGNEDRGVDRNEGSAEEGRQHRGPFSERLWFSKLKSVEPDNGEVEEGEEDIEANEDLSLQIVEKARKRQKVEVNEGVVVYEDRVGRRRVQELVDDKRGTEGNSVAEEDRVQEPLSRSETPEEGELQEDGEGNLVLAADLFEKEEVPDGGGQKKKKKKKEKNEKKKRKKGVDSEQNKGKSDSKDEKLVGAEESIVMRKLLRGPRYFDPPEELDQSCSNCGKVGHLAGGCAEGPRLKPCYVCGAFGHDGRDCPQRTDCYACGKVGHIAKNCPNKGLRTPTSRGDEIICLVCGRPGHETSTCYYDYDEQDVEQVQCYICKQFGHLSCVNIVDTTPVPVSCHLCGEMGHTGEDCGRTRRSDRDKDRDRSSASVCFKCGEEGHFARQCSKRRGRRPAPWSSEETVYGVEFTTPSSKHERRNGAVPRWMDLQSREGRWAPPGRTHAGHRSVGTSSKRRFPSDENQDYMGPIESFVDNSKENLKSRRRRSWAAGGGRKRS